MISLQATIRQKKDKTDSLRKRGFLPGVLYGEGIQNASVAVNERDFEKVFKEAGETSIIALEVDGKKTEVLIHETAQDPVSGNFLHIDFFHPSSKRKMEAAIPLVFEGEAEAVKALGGVLVKELNELNVRGLAKDFPKEIIVDVSVLKSLEDKIVIQDLTFSSALEIVGKHQDDIVAHVVLPKEEEEIKEPEAPTALEDETASEISAEEKEEGKEKK
ncbi:MAG: 50S ribosomal protein L25 [Candidatus Pacebacteria bacterium]|nr:50S ribosomal protein L25 [Candidatus Paceibacterota bacterium]